jgi:hypothetical protein
MRLSDTSTCGSSTLSCVAFECSKSLACPVNNSQGKEGETWARGRTEGREDEFFSLTVIV